MEPPIVFWLGVGVFITFLVVVSYRSWAQARSDINAAALRGRVGGRKMQQLGFASNTTTFKVTGESFFFTYFCVVLGFGQRCFWFSVPCDNLGERMVNIEWATNTQNTLCFTAVVCALEVLYNQRAKASSAE